LEKITFFVLIWWWKIYATGCAGFEGFIHNDERKESKSDAEHSEGDKKTKIGSFKKKAINAGNKFRHSLRRRSKKKNFSIEDIRDVKELQDVETFRQCLVDEDLLPQQHDDYHMMLRYNTCSSQGFHFTLFWIFFLSFLCLPNRLTENLAPIIYECSGVCH
jgi:hypothetical protein